MNDRNLLDHGRRIAELERKVSELYERLGQAEPTGFDTGYGFSDAAPPAGAVDDPRLVELIQSGKTIHAIKLYRELTGAGLGEAKDAVEQLARSHGVT